MLGATKSGNHVVILNLVYVNIYFTMSLSDFLTLNACHGTFQTSQMTNLLALQCMHLLASLKLYLYMHNSYVQLFTTKLLCSKQARSSQCIYINNYYLPGCY